jgi:hypothetical protein
LAERASERASEMGHSQLLHRDVQAPIPTKTRSATSVIRISCVRYGLRARLQEATGGRRPCGSGGDPALPGAHLADTLTCALGEPAPTLVHYGKNPQLFSDASNHGKFPIRWLNQGLRVQIEHFLSLLWPLRGLTNHGQGTTSVGAAGSSCPLTCTYHIHAGKVFRRQLTA